MDSICCLNLIGCWYHINLIIFLIITIIEQTNLLDPSVDPISESCLTVGFRFRRPPKLSPTLLYLSYSIYAIFNGLSLLVLMQVDVRHGIATDTLRSMIENGESSRYMPEILVIN